MAINTWLGNYEHVIQALVALGTVGSVGASLYLATDKKAKVKGEVYFMINPEVKKDEVSIEDVKSSNKNTFFAVEIKNTGDIDIELKTFQVVLRLFGITSFNIYKYKFQRLIPKRSKKDVYFVDLELFNLSLSKNGYMIKFPIDGSVFTKLRFLYKNRCFISEKNQKRIKFFLKFTSFTAVLIDELDQEFKLTMCKNVIETLKEIVRDSD